jgi:hypothetical protein
MEFQFARIKNMTPALKAYQAQAKSGSWQNIAKSNMNPRERLIACSWYWAALAQYHSAKKSPQKTIKWAIANIPDPLVRDATEKLLA